MEDKSRGSSAKVISVAVGMIVRPQQNREEFECWLQPRSDQEFLNLWEFPGGKCEGEETPQAALRRELQEECEIDIGSEGFYLGRSFYQYPTKGVILHLFVVHWDQLKTESLQLPSTGRWFPLCRTFRASKDKIYPSTLTQTWGVQLLPANYSLVEDLMNALYDVGHESTS
jgi:mutator protein MutT